MAKTKAVSKKELRKVADRIDELVKNSQPYDLTFYYDSATPLTNGQRTRLQEYLRHQFHDIWANTWLHLVSDNIREAIGDRPIHKGGDA